MTSNQIAYANYMETVRHNKKSEGFTKRSTDIAAKNARTARQQVGLGYANLDELYRHNYAMEGLTEQQNEVKKDEVEVRQYEAEIKDYESKTKRIEAYAKMLPDWLVALGYGTNELMESAIGDKINETSEQVYKNVHENPKSKHRKR